MGRRGRKTTKGLFIFDVIKPIFGFMRNGRYWSIILRGWSFLMGNTRPECFPQKIPKF